jgi:predicted  nucleic acid-binding Zn-ribbon protein
MLQDTIYSLKQQNEHANNKIRSLNEKVSYLENEVSVKAEENTCSLNCLELLRNNFLKESKKNNELNDKMDYMKSQIDKLNNSSAQCGQIIVTLEDRIITLQNIIGEKENEISLLNKTVKTNNNILRNEYENNKTKIFKLKSYIHDLNELIETSMTPNEVLKMVQGNLEQSYDVRMKLENEIKELNDKLKKNETDIWNVSDDKWIVIGKYKNMS